MSWTDDIAYLLQNIVITYYLLFMFLFHVLRRKQQITEYWNIETFGSFSQGQGMLAWGLLSGNKIRPTVFRPSRTPLSGLEYFSSFGLPWLTYQRLQMSTLMLAINETRDLHRTIYARTVVVCRTYETTPNLYILFY